MTHLTFTVKLFPTLLLLFKNEFLSYFLCSPLLPSFNAFTVAFQIVINQKLLSSKMITCSFSLQTFSRWYGKNCFWTLSTVWKLDFFEVLLTILINLSFCPHKYFDKEFEYILIYILVFDLKIMIRVKHQRSLRFSGIKLLTFISRN